MIPSDRGKKKMKEEDEWKHSVSKSRNGDKII